METDKNLQDLLDWSICEKNNDGELKPTSDFLVWYYEYLVHSVSEHYGEDWGPIVDPDNITDKQQEQMDKDEEEREEFIKDCIENQIAIWTSQKIGKQSIVKDVNDKHVKIIYDLINDIDNRLMDIQAQKNGGKRSDLK